MAARSASAGAAADAVDAIDVAEARASRDTCAYDAPMRPRDPRVPATLVLAALCVISCGSRNVVVRPDTSEGALPAASLTPVPTPVHTSAPISDPHALGASRVMLGRRAENYGQFANPMLVMLNNRNMTVGATYQVGPWPGFLYVNDGTMTTKDSSGLLDVRSGEARAIPDGLWEEQNAGPAPADYVLTFLNDNTARNEWNDRAVLMSPMLDSPRDVRYHLQLDRITIDAGGRTESMVHGGAVGVFVLSGAVEVRESNGVRHFVGAREASYVAPQTGLQIFALDGKPAAVLEFFYTPDDRQFAVALDASP
jgi:hypothetical protein